MEFYRSEEYRELPDEFNRNIREEPVREILVLEKISLSGQMKITS